MLGNHYITPSLLTTLLGLYVDPGYGTLVWQLLLATFFGGLFQIRRIKEFISRRKRSENVDQ